VRSDGLVLKNVCNRLEISWEARAVHPWDEDLSPHAKKIAFAEQALEDTEAAVKPRDCRCAGIECAQVLSPIPNPERSAGQTLHANLYPKNDR
jgi:hypothetical protein